MNQMKQVLLSLKTPVMAIIITTTITTITTTTLKTN